MEIKSTTIKERVLIFIKNQGYKVSKFFPEIEESYDNFKGQKLNSALSSDVLVKLRTKFPDLNMDWLLTGEGKMLNKINNIPVNLPNHSETNNDHNQNSIDMNTDKLIAVIESQNVMIRQKDEEIRQLRAELDELRGYSPIKKSRVG